MSASGDRTVLIPATLNEALMILRRRPGLPLWAGGTWWGSAPPAIRVNGETILALHGIREMKRVVRSEEHVDVGGAVVLSRLRESGYRFLPPLLLAALETAGPPPVQNLATCGGAVSTPELILPIRMVLELLDARVEYRRFARSRISPISTAQANPTEVLYRIRIPLMGWSHWMLEQFGTVWPPGGSSLAIAAAAFVEKNSIQEFHLGVLIDGIHLIRLKETETDILGRPVPLTERDQRIILSPLEEHPIIQERLDDLGRWRVTGAARQFLRRLG